MVAFFQPN